jgi:Arc/MetJ-type ribon-helix-helix transcriptional regulator
MSTARPSRPRYRRGYGSASEVIREALRDCQLKHAAQLREFAALKADIEVGMADVGSHHSRKRPAALG